MLDQIFQCLFSGSLCFFILWMASDSAKNKVWNDVIWYGGSFLMMLVVFASNFFDMIK